MKSKNIENILNSVITDLNYKETNKEEILDEGLLDYLKSAGRGVANAGRTASMAATNLSQHVGSALETDTAIIRQGLLLYSKEGKPQYLGFRGVQANTPQANDVARMYMAKGYNLATDAERQAAANQKITVVAPEQNDANLRPEMLKLAQGVTEAAKNFYDNVNKTPLLTVTSLDVNGSITNLLNASKAIIAYAEESQKKAAPASTQAASVATEQQPQQTEPQQTTEQQPQQTEPQQTTEQQPQQATEPQVATTPAKQPLDFNSLPMAPDTQGLSAGAAQLQSPEVRHRIATAANQDEDNTPHGVGESKSSLGPLDIFLG